MLVGGPLGAISNALLRGPAWLSRLGLTIACAGLGLLLLTAFLAAWSKGEV